MSVIHELFAGSKALDVHLLAVCRGDEQLQTFLQHLPSKNRDSSLTLKTHVTGQTLLADVEKEADGSIEEAPAPEKSKKVLLTDIRRARPDLKAVIRSHVSSSTGQRLAIVACGPDSFMQDIREEVAVQQMLIAQGKSAVQDIWLRSESYHW